MSDNLRLEVSVDVPEADGDELDRLTRSLRFELEDLGVESVAPLPGLLPPAGSKTADPITLGALAVIVLPTLLPKLVDFLQHWIKRAEGKRRIRVRIETNGRSTEIELDGSERTVEEVVELALEASEEWTGAKRG